MLLEGAGVGSQDRITIPIDLAQAARGSERELLAPQSDVRPLVPMLGVPWLIITHDELRRLPLDSLAGFVVSLIDGRCTVEMILDVAGMPEDDVIALLRKLAELGAIEFRDP
jgi:hypothetical protein